jgi:hypothetical protein
MAGTYAGLVLVVGGVLIMLTAIVADTQFEVEWFKAALRSQGAVSKGRQVLMAVLGFAVAVLGVLILTGVIADGSMTPTSIGATTTSVYATPTYPVSTPTTLGTAGVIMHAPGCAITMTNPLAQMYSSPSSADNSVSVPPGTYEPIEYQNVPFAGTSAIWYEISVAGRVGWVTSHNGVDIASQSSECPL